MTNTAIATDSPLVEDQAVQLRRAIIASTIGTMIEWYHRHGDRRGEGCGEGNEARMTDAA
jgi:hypothetical protein